MANKEVLTESERVLLLEFDELKQKIAEERELFDTFVKSYVDTRLTERYAQPCKEVVLLGRDLTTPADATNDLCYSIQTAITLEDPKNEWIIETELTLEEKDLKAIGSVQTLQFRTETPLVGTLPKSVKLARQYLVKDPDITRSYNAFIGTTGRKCGGIFLTSDVLYHLLSAESCSAWTIPFLVQESDSSETFVYFKSGVQKPNSLSQMELERIGELACYHSALFTRDHHHSYSFDNDGQLKEVGEGTELAQRENTETADDDDDDEEAPLVIEDVEEESNKVETTPPIKEPPAYKLIEFDEYLLKHSKTDEHGEPHNFIVNRVNLRLKSGPESTSFPVVVTSSGHGLYKQRLVTLSFKIEYRSEFGAQKMGLDELLKEWCSVAFCKNITHVVRVRIDYKTSIVLSVENLSQADIEKEINRLYQLTPARLLTRVYNLLSMVTRFPVGKYLLDKETGQSQILIHMETEQREVGKLWKDLFSGPVMLHHPRPSFLNLPIDGQVVTQLHRINGTLPGCNPRPSVKAKNYRIGSFSGKRCFANKKFNYPQTGKNVKKKKKKKAKNKGSTGGGSGQKVGGGVGGAPP